MTVKGKPNVGYVVALHMSQMGIKRTMTPLSDQPVGEGREISNQNDTKITNVEGLEAARELSNQARLCFAKHATRACDAYFVDEPTLVKLVDGLNEIKRDISAHNARYPESAISKCNLRVFPLELDGPKAAALARDLFADVEETLIAIEKHTRAGEFKEAMELVNASGNLSAVVPMIVKTLVDDALDQVRNEVKGARAELRDEERAAVKRGKAYFGDPAAKGLAMRLDKLEAAIGWVTSAEPDATDASATQAQASA